ncbi:TraB family protein [archaeon]|jgi:pheromone shutdown-related protein TraB|nr:TraB family protein [archaeon]MBT3721062.1 TraB family protein [archaeon]MBT4272232.1 TraB family protein [archaeon]MBT4460615.1 TraB family protein [archaeon]MBT4857982.1 TraB family protein [archaeon]
MKNINNIYVLGTSHVAKQSVSQVKKQIRELNPEIVAIELDKNRLHSLQHNTKRPKNLEMIKYLGLGGFLFYIFGEFAQKKIGKILDINPGEDMFTAYKTAKKNKSKIALIDRDIQITLRRFSKFFKFKELVKIIFDILKGTKTKETIDLNNVPSDKLIEFVISEVKDKYPTIYKVLVYERDIYMGKKLVALSLVFPNDKILAVVGAGHVNGITKYLKKILNSNEAV